MASEQKALLILPWVDRSPTIEAALRYLAMARTDDVPHATMLAGIKSLPAGHWAEWDGSELHITRYFRAEADPRPVTPEIMRTRLLDAVNEQLVGDVPIGATVSGGLDSSSVALLADRARKSVDATAPLHLFAYHDTLAEQDERSYQRAVLGNMQSAHVVHWVSSNPDRLATELEHYIHHQEEPYGDVSSYAEYCIAREAASAGVKVLLNGLGGDEVFMGYPSFLGPLLVDLVTKGQFLDVIALLKVSPKLGNIDKTYALRSAPYHALPSRLRNTISAFKAGRLGGLSPSLQFAAARDAYSTYHLHDGQGATNSALRGSVESWCIPRYLAHSDRMLLSFSVEGRVPLLDERLIAGAWAVPPRARFDQWGLKATLRNAAWDVLPTEVRNRTWKLGFHAPLGKYVDRLDPSLREGMTAAHALLGASPDWEAMHAAERWRWGSLGLYLNWSAKLPRTRNDWTGEPMPLQSEMLSQGESHPPREWP